VPAAEVHILDAGHFALDEQADAIADRVRRRRIRHRRDLTAIARASFWVGRTAVTDQGPARVVHRRDRVDSGATVDRSST
jgi:hypothetical protein